MTLIEPVIKPGDSGPHVSNLQAGILLLVEHGVIKSYDPPNLPTPDDLKALAQKLRSEQAAQLFGAATQQLLRYFQIQQGLGDHLHGIVEDATAKLLNELLKALGAFESSDIYEVFGTLRDAADMSPASAVRVMAYAQDVARLAPLGEARTDGGGQYRITFDFVAFRITAAERGGPELLVHALNDQGAVIGKSQLVRNAGRRTELSFLVETRCVVRGTVTDQRGRPVVGHKVVAYDQDLRIRQRLGDAPTNANGNYEIPYQHEAVVQAEGATSPAPDLLVEVLPHGSLVPLGRSPVRFHAKRVETIDLVVSVAEEGPTEFERLTAAIMPLLVGQGVKAEDLTNDDVRFIVTETELDAAAVQAWVQSACAQRDALQRIGDNGEAGQPDVLRIHAWPFFFAVFQSRMAADLDGTLRRTLDEWRDAQHSAQAMHRVPAMLKANLDILIAALSRLNQLLLLDASRSPRSPIAQIRSLAPIPLPDAVALKALDIEQAHGTDNPDVFLKLAESYPAAVSAVHGFVRAMRLHNLTGGDLHLANALNARFETDAHSLAPLAALSTQAWTEALTMAQVPGVSGVEGIDLSARALGLQAQVEQMYPQAALMNRLETGVVRFNDPALSMARNVVAEHPTVVDSLLKNDAVEPRHLEALGPKIVNTFRNVGRYVGVGLVMEAASDLINAGIESPGHALVYGRDVIYQLLGNTYPSGHIDSYWHHIERIHKGSKGMLGSVIATGRLPWVLGGGKKDVPAEVRENLPTLRGLLGDLDECLCRPCESVLGVSAYLVDLLNLLKTVPLRSGSTVSFQGVPATALSVLRHRRPDIFNLALTCENLEKNIQHIDLVLEVLERAVVQISGGGDAYAALAVAVYPWLLPLDCGAIELHAHLQRLGVSRADLLALIDAPPPDALASSTLDITVRQQGGTLSEWDLITVSRTGTSLWDTWGMSLAPGQVNITIHDSSSGLDRTGMPSDVLGWASVLMDRTGLELNELEEVLASRFVGGISLTGLDECKPSLMQLPVRTEQVYDRIHRLVRLWRKLPGWSVSLLDSVLLAYHPAAGSIPALHLDANVLKALATAERARFALDLSPEAVLALRMPMGRIQIHPGNGGDLLSHVFAWRTTVTATTLTAVLDKVAASLRADSRELAELLTQGIAQRQASDVPDVANLTWLYRSVTLARALNIEAPQLIGLQAVTGLQPFEEVSATLSAQAGFQRLLDLHAAAQAIAASGLSIQFCATVLMPPQRLSGSGRGLIKTSDEIIQNLRQLQAALRQESHVTPAAGERDVAHTLASLLGLRDAEQVLSALREASEPSSSPSTGLTQSAVTILSTSGKSSTQGRRFGEARPLFTAAEATELLSIVQASRPNPSFLDRLDRLHLRITERMQEQRLLEVLHQQTALTEEALVDLLMGGLDVDPTPGTAQPRRAGEVLLAKAFWSGDTAPAVDEAVRPDLHDWMQRLDRLVAMAGQLSMIPAFGELVRRIKMGPVIGTASPRQRSLDWRVLFAPRSATSGPSWNVQWGDWRELLDLVWLAQQEQLSGPVLVELFANLDQLTGAVPEPALRPLAERLRITSAEVLAMARLVAARVDADSLRTPSVLRRLCLLAQRLRPAHVSASMVTVLLDVANNTTAAQTAKSLLQAKLGVNAGSVMTSIEDRLRMQRRDALVAWLLYRLNCCSPEDLHERYLIDTQVQSCFKTTRTLQAVASVQLFIQRILHGAEQDLSQGVELKRRWCWMRSYRVWEANRKVFLFPENWLFPELRDDKSSSFRQLESLLGQGELTGDLASQAFGQFLDDVATVGQTQVLGLFEEVIRAPAPPHKKIRRDLYVVGRTINPPYYYYWRKCVDFGGVGMEWSPWQRVELDIQGDHVLPVLISGELYLVWPIFKRGEVAGRAIPTWEIRMAWSRFNGKSWLRQETSRELRKVEAKPFRDERSGFSFRCEVDHSKSEATFTAYMAAQPITSTFTPPATGTPNHIRNFGPGANNKWTNILFNQLHDYPTASLQVRWRAWIKLKNDDEEMAWIELLPDHNRRIQLCRTEDGWKGEMAQMWSRSSIPSSHWTVDVMANGIRLPAPQAQEIPEIQPPDEFQYVLHFEIDATAYYAKTLGFEGLDIPKAFESRLQFVLGRSNENRWEALSQPAQLAPPQHCRPWMNGYAEDEVLGLTDSGVFLADSTIGRQLTVFPTSRAAPYFILGAASHRSHEEAAAIVHFAEGPARAYVDLDVTGRSHMTAFRLYADGFSGALRNRKAWLLSGSVGDATLQAGDFDAALLPVPGTLVQTDGAGQVQPGGMWFDRRFPYASYNWEIFYHAPLLIADQLSKQQQFEDAERWMRLVFDPTSGEQGTDARRFLRFRVFKELDPAEDVARQLTLLARAAGKTATSVEVEEMRGLIERWQDLPFRPFLIARWRHLAFLWRTLFAYLDNLIAWADSLYRRDTREAIGEATLLYVLASRILGPKPKVHDSGTTRTANTYDGITGEWDEFVNLWVDTSPPSRRNRYSPHSFNLETGRQLFALEEDEGSGDGYLHFCIPFNDKLLTYWNTVESRLFNIRHCRNLDGVKRELPFLDPSIDPELLVRATAAGLDLGDVIAGLYASPPHYRYSILSGRAAELAHECKSLGAAMLSAIEKRDAEHLAQLRSSNEINLLKLVQDVRAMQITEAERNIEGLRASRKSVESRYSQYQRLLGKKDITLPKEQESTGEESMLGRVDDGTSGLSHLGLIDAENKHIEDLDIAYGWMVAGGISKGVAAATHMAASIVRAVYPPPVAGTDAGHVPTTVLTAVGTGVSAVGDMFDLVSRGWQHGANKQSILGSHIRRRDEWAFQSNQTLKELQQIDKQILANQIRIGITQKEFDNHLEQAKQAKAVDEVMRSKFSNVQLYEWMKTELSRLYFNAYRMAVDMARLAERAASRELGVKPLNIVRNDYWDSLRDGLLAGERLYQDLKRLEIAYFDQNRREYEMTKHVSLKRLNPLALLALKASGQCELEIPEWIHDMETPGHYMRRIKMVSVSVPCIVGPYASVNCKLTLLRNDVRHSTSVDGGYAKSSQGDDDRFTVRYGAAESIVTSTARDDSGMFEPNLRDERYLPFEGAGASGRWRLEIPKKSAQFDFDTISDVVIHIRYTARDGGDELRKHAEAQWVPELPAPRPVVRYPHLLSCRTDFSNEWNAAKSGAGSVRVRLEQSLLPYWMTALNFTIRKVSTLTWPLTDPANPQPVERWPAQTTGALTLSLNGTGVADFGLIPQGAEDMLIVLEVGNG